MSLKLFGVGRVSGGFGYSSTGLKSSSGEGASVWWKERSAILDSYLDLKAKGDELPAFIDLNLGRFSHFALKPSTGKRSVSWFPTYRVREGAQLISQGRDFRGISYFLPPQKRILIHDRHEMGRD